MTNNKTRFSSVNPHWFADLVEQQAPIGLLVESPTLEDDVVSVNNHYLEISRAGNILRGGLFLGGLVIAALLCWSVPLLLRISAEPDDEIFFTLVNWILLAAVMLFSIFLIYLDCRIPRDTPVRFDRETGKVSAYEYPLGPNPLARRVEKIKTFDWHNVQAELTRQAGFNGKAYMVRYGLVLVICRPGTNEVVDRVILKSNDMTVNGLIALWDYVRSYMSNGLISVPAVTPRSHKISLINSLFIYMPYLNPTSEGRHFRRRMQPVDLVMVLLTIWFFWIWLPMGICHYIAMKCAPEPHWPAEMDVY